jgi:hypothetical protein
MPQPSGAKKSKPILKTVLLGLVTAGLYVLAFARTDLIMPLFTKGGVYAALPIATVFVVSFAHGSFASNLWSVLGIEADMKKPAKQDESRPVRPTKRPRPRLRMTA